MRLAVFGLLVAVYVAGVEVRVTPMRTEVIIRATRTQNVLGAWTLLLLSLVATCCPAMNRFWLPLDAVCSSLTACGNRTHVVLFLSCMF